MEPTEQITTEIDELKRRFGRREIEAARRTRETRGSRGFALLLAALVCAGGVARSPGCLWRLSFVGRSAAIGLLLPGWDWTSLAERRCLVERSADVGSVSSAPAVLECAACENHPPSVPRRLAGASYDLVVREHLSRGAPVVVTDADVPPFDARDVLDALGDGDRCELRTNLRTRLGRPTESPFRPLYPGWFVHFRDCGRRTVRALRRFAPRPYFLSPHVPPPHSVWLLASDGYAAPDFRRLDVDPGLIALHQLRGATEVRLIPRRPCRRSCVPLRIDVRSGEVLAVANSLWELEYAPDPTSENAAALTETEWDEA